MKMGNQKEKFREKNTFPSFPFHNCNNNSKDNDNKDQRNQDPFF